ncbi:MAG: L-seryl-tRNA(Sec) selenium transferase [Acidobacteria bacterium]|nr:L-seryl-tRNA(Sec) selenium transferase [Acidobacteriota bacterium]
MGPSRSEALYRTLPSVDELLREPEIAAFADEEGRSAAVDACRAVLAGLREEIAAGHIDPDRLQIALAGIHAAVRSELGRALGCSLKPVINATGVILHTNLGRAPLAESAIMRVRETAETYSNLELDLESGERGKRDVHVDRLFRKLLSEESRGPRPAGRPGTPVSFEAEKPEDPLLPARAGTSISTIVVNNNAAAVLLALNTLAEGGEVVVSRGELVEIGGSFRIPDVMAKSGAALREVGTTNRTRIADYERAINERTRLLLRVHRSNFEITGFTEQPGLQELALLAAKYKLPLVEDLGSGALFDLRRVGITNEPTVLDSLRAGVEVVTFSGDKLLGGPQAGLISGREGLVERMRANPLFRALRVDKLTYAALEATLLAYVKRDYGALPVLRMIELSNSEIAARAENLTAGLAPQAGGGACARGNLRIELTGGVSLVGGGSAPSAVLPTTLIAITSEKRSADELAARLRRASPPVIARMDQGRLLLDLRTVFPSEDALLRKLLSEIASQT